MNDIIKEGLIAIIRGVPQNQILPVTEAMYEGGVRIIEVAFNASDGDTVAKTTQAISTISAALGDVLTVGAGTVLTTSYVEAAYQAGAKFIFSPNTNEKVIRLTKQLGLISIPGAYTPTEMAAAYDFGADIIKLFPITRDEIGYVRNITRPLSHIPFICVGGTSLETIEDFFLAGALGVGTGLSILKPEYVETGNYEGIKELAKLHVEKVRECQKRRSNISM